MNINTPNLPYETQRTRRGSSSFGQRLGKAMPLHVISVADWLQIASVVVAGAVVWLALYYTR